MINTIKIYVATYKAKTASVKIGSKTFVKTVITILIIIIIEFNLLKSINN